MKDSTFFFFFFTFFRKLGGYASAVPRGKPGKRTKGNQKTEIPIKEGSKRKSKGDNLIRLQSNWPTLLQEVPVRNAPGKKVKLMLHDIGDHFGTNISKYVTHRMKRVRENKARYHAR